MRRNDIIYNAPYELDGDKEVIKRVKIPKSKCVIIEFPNELGGYKGYNKKIKEVKKLGSKFKYSENPGANIKHMKNWDKQFNKIVSDWGASNKIEDVTEFYQELSALKFRYLVICCTHEIVNGLKQLIGYLNIKLNENAEIEFNTQLFNKEYFKDIQKKWMNGELSFEETNKYLKL